MLDKEHLKQVMSPAKTYQDSVKQDTRIATFILPLTKAMAEYQINTLPRIRMFIAQLMHESGEFRYVEELASGEAYDVGRLATNLGNTPEDDGDGEKFKGRGLIQITGRKNYEAVSKELKYDFIKDPESLEKPGAASYSAAWFWKSRRLNELADGNDIASFKLITKRINGGLNGWDDRLKYWERAQKYIL